MKFNLLYSKYSSEYRKSFRYENRQRKETFKDLASLSVKNDDTEIKRGKTYAVFLELQNPTQENPVTVTRLIDSLNARKIQNSEFQQKILSALHQQRLSLFYRLGSIVNGIMQEKVLCVEGSRKLSLQVVNKNKVNLVFDMVLNQWEGGAPLVRLSTLVEITPKHCVLKLSNLELLNSSKQAREVQELFKAQQQNIIMQIITWLKHKLGFYGDFVMYKFPKVEVAQVVSPASDNNDAVSLQSRPPSPQSIG